ncbi:unnamed protein product [Spirodela intermedia]|uniref:Carbohydrate kinase PfkB domain-containing protein n=1 Tax=Spirodela intermedia TaxID=51605 RepID=A0A7I8IDN5_SPIIN|nr:unnamed protein product [Spirodela intermedia]CAA6655152.1 unnamed protein product [Spirodela intermedia]
MIEICRVVFVDVQALIRTFDPTDGTVRLVHLRDSGFSHLLPRIGFLKASADEAPFVDVEEVRKLCCVVVTDGKDGCRVYWKSGVLRVPSFPAVQVDPTGAGDSFLGGFVAGMVHGLAVPDAALLGNFFGSLTVRHIGIPNFHQELFQFPLKMMGWTVTIALLLESLVWWISIQASPSPSSISFARKSKARAGMAFSTALRRNRPMEVATLSEVAAESAHCP